MHLQKIRVNSDKRTKLEGWNKKKVSISLGSQQILKNTRESNRKRRRMKKKKIFLCTIPSSTLGRYPYGYFLTAEFSHDTVIFIFIFSIFIIIILYIYTLKNIFKVIKPCFWLQYMNIKAAMSKKKLFLKSEWPFFCLSHFSLDLFLQGIVLMFVPKKKKKN